MEFRYPYNYPVASYWWAVSLHVLLLAVALAPLAGLFFQTRRPVRQLDAWLWIGCIFSFPVPLTLAVLTLPLHFRPFLIGLLVFAEVVSAAAFFVTLSRLWTKGGAVNVLNVLGGLLLLCLFVALLLPSVPAAREAARRMSCGNNIKQVILAVHNYHDAYHILPSAVGVNENGVETSWRVLLLPYLENQRLYETYDQTQPWNSQANQSISLLALNALACPSNPIQRDDQGRFYTAYAMLLGPDASLVKTGRRDFSDASGGTANALAVVEACGRNIVWTKPQDVDLSQLPLGVNRPGRAEHMSYGALSSFHPGGAQAALLDGSVRFISESIDPEVLRQLASAKEAPRETE